MNSETLEADAQLSPRRAVWLLMVVFALSRVVYYWLGVRCGMSGIGIMWQYLDEELLRTRLLESCFYLHSQPPLFNLFLGGVLQLFGQSAPLVFHLVYLALSLAMCWAVLSLQLRLGVRCRVAFCVTLLFLFSPATVLYENFLFYTLPVASLLALAGVCLHEGFSRGKLLPITGFFGLLVAVCVIRSAFHILFYLLALAIVVACWPKKRRRIVAVGLACGLVILSVYVKNAVVFGKFSASTWIGMNASAMTTGNMPLAQRRALMERGQLSPLAEIVRFSPLEEYPSQYRQAAAAYPDVPALQDERKSSGAVNYNHAAYISISDQYLRDAKTVLRRRPSTVVLGLCRSWFGYFKAADDYIFLETNGRKIAWTRNLYDYLLYGKIPINLTTTGILPIYSGRPQYVYLLLVFGLPVLAIYGVRSSLRGLRTGQGPAWPERITLWYVVGTILYVALIGNCFETGENNRFRFVTDPMYHVLLGLAAQGVLAWWGRRRVHSLGMATTSSSSNGLGVK